jgi:RNA polymerase sigma-70 factor (ECF subfamily)
MTDVETIWKDYHDKLHRFIASRVADASTVDDLLQEVFVKIHQRIGTLQDDARIQGWLYQVTRNAVIDYFRSRRPLEDIPEEASMPETSQSTALMELAECIRPMVERLPQAHREATVLSELEGLTQKEVSERLGISLSGAKSRVQRGRAKLRELMMDCCHIEFDHRGSVIGYDPKKKRCDTCQKNC